MTGRPALLTRRPDWGMPETLVQLAPLVAAQSNELAQALLQRMAAVPVQLTELYPRTLAPVATRARNSAP